MKFLIVFALFASACAVPYGYGAPEIRITSAFDSPAPLLHAAPLGYGEAVAVKSFEPIPIVRHLLNDDNYGTYDLEVATGNGIHSTENGILKSVAEGPGSVKSGSYSYTSPEGIPITTNWVADEFGFRASGAHLPVPPPVPVEIARSLHASSYGGYGSALVF